MKTLSKISLIVLILLMAMFAFPGTALAQTPNNGNDQMVFGGTYTLPAGQTLTGNLVVFGGLATIEKGAVVTGDIALTGGSLNVSGEIKGGITSVGGSINLSDTAVVDGDINTVGGTLNRSGQTVIKGNISTSGPGAIRLPLNWNLNGLRNLPLADIFHPIGNVLWGIFQSLAVAALALLVVLFMPTPTRRVSNSIIAQPVVAGGLGLLTVVVAPALVVLLAITILLIPLSLIGILLLAVAFLYGWIAVGLEAGDRLAGLFKVQWAAPGQRRYRHAGAFIFQQHLFPDPLCGMGAAYRHRHPWPGRCVPDPLRHPRRTVGWAGRCAPLHPAAAAGHAGAALTLWDGRRRTFDSITVASSS